MSEFQREKLGTDFIQFNFIELYKFDAQKSTPGSYNLEILGIAEKCQFKFSIQFPFLIKFLH